MFRFGWRTGSFLSMAIISVLNTLSRGIRVGLYRAPVRDWLGIETNIQLVWWCRPVALEAAHIRLGHCTRLYVALSDLLQRIVPVLAVSLTGLEVRLRRLFLTQSVYRTLLGGSLVLSGPVVLLCVQIKAQAFERHYRVRETSVAWEYALEASIS